MSATPGRAARRAHLQKQKFDGIPPASRAAKDFGGVPLPPVVTVEIEDRLRDDHQVVFPTGYVAQGAVLNEIWRRGGPRLLKRWLRRRLRGLRRRTGASRGRRALSERRLAERQARNAAYKLRIAALADGASSPAAE